MPLDAEDKKTIAEMIKETLGGDTLTKTIGEAAAAAVKGLKLKDTIKAQVDTAVKAAVPEPKDDPKDKSKGKADDKVAAQLEAMQTQLEEERTAREKAEAARRTDRLHSTAQAALVASDVPGDRVKAAMALLQTEGLLEVAEDGSPVMKGKDKFGAEALIPVKDGIDDWLKTDEGKLFLPPTDAQGTGDGATTVNFKTGKGEVDLDRVRKELKKNVLGTQIAG